jgi:hypothetical protein
MLKKLGIAVIMVLMIPLAASAVSLTGKWTSNDGGTCYIREVANDEIFWLHENDPASPTYSNVAHGKRHADRVILSWGDVPKGSATHQGILVLKITDNTNKLVVILKTGGFLANTWTRNP